MIDHPYPLVTCGAHPHMTPRPGWLVCVHIAANVRTPIGYLQTPTRDDLGRLMCTACRMQPLIDSLKLACPECVNDILRAREMRP